MADPAFVETEIKSQPDCWQEVADRAASAGQVLPRPGERVAVIGCGTSLYMAQAYARLREEARQGETDAFPASEMLLSRRYDRVVAITRSGTTTEVLAALGALPSGVPTVAITADDSTPVAERAGDVITLEFADEQSVVQTRFATTTLMLLRAHLGADVAPVIEAGRAALDADLPAGLVDSTQITFLGRGWTVGLANEAGLKLREAAGAWTESYPAMEYRHGPISVTGPTTAVWMLGELPAGLADDVEATGAALVVSPADPLADLIRIQRLAVHIARSRGLDPDNPRHLTRSVVLSGERTDS